MFRGGQVIDSRGTGITSGLMDGGRVGYSNGGDIITGGQLLKDASMPVNFSDLNKLNFSAASPLILKSGAANQTIKDKVEDEVETGKDVMEGSVIDKVSDSKTLTEELGDPLGSDFDTTEIVDGKVVIKPAAPLTELQKAKIANLMGTAETRENLARLQKEEADRLAKEKKDTTAKVIFDEDDDEIIDPNKNKEVPTELSAKEMVAENKKLFAEMLGMDKARSSDIGDMLLRFAAAPGATTQEKFQTYLQAESQAGKGRAEKINETAAALAINDYVAGKRSKENLAQTLAAVDYKIDKTLKGSVPQPDDDWRTAVFKAAGKDDSISSDKTLGKALAGKFGKSVASIQVKEIADINTDKVKEDFIVGFNIVTLKDGNKVIVEKGASGEIKIRDDLPVY
jgi:hypothetical protein